MPMRTDYPYTSFPVHPPPTSIGPGLLLTEQAVRQYEDALRVDWFNIQNRPSELKGIPWINPRDLPFGAQGDGITDDTEALQAALDSAPDGAVFFLPKGVFRADGLTTSSSVHILGTGTIKMRKNSPSDRVLDLSHPGCILDGITLDGAAAEHTSYAGRGEALKVSGDGCVLRDVSANNTPVTDFASCLYVVGADVRVEGFSSTGCGYAAVRANGNRGIYRGLKLTNWRKKGFLIDSNVDRCILDGAYITSDTTTSGVECILVDPGSNGPVGSFYLQGVRCEGPNQVLDLNNVVKLVLVDRAYIDGCEFLNTSDNLTSLRIQEGVDYLYLSRSRLSQTVNFDSEGEHVYITDCVLGTGEAPAHSQVIEQCKARVLDVRRTRFFNYNGAAIRLEAGSTFQPKCLVDGVELEAAAGQTSAALFSLGYTPVPGDIKVASYTVLVGSNNGVNNLTALTGSDALIQQGSLSEWGREFRAVAMPTSGVWKQGDVVKNIVPSAGNPPAWVCVTVPVTFKPMASLGA